MTRSRRPSAAAWLLMVLLAWPALHVAAYILGTTPGYILGVLIGAAAYGLGFLVGVLCLVSLCIQLLRR